MVMTPDVYDGLDGSIGAFSDYRGELVPADLPNGAVFDIAVVDHTISDLLVHPLATPSRPGSTPSPSCWRCDRASRSPVPTCSATPS